MILPLVPCSVLSSAVSQNMCAYVYEAPQQTACSSDDMSLLLCASGFLICLDLTNYIMDPQLCWSDFLLSYTDAYYY